MKVTAVVLATLTGLVAAQDISIIPSCAQPCILDAIPKATSCKTTDFACVCKSQDALVGAATACVIKACGADVATGKVLPATQEFCKQALAGGSSSGAASSGAASTSAAASSAAPSSAAPSSSAAAPSSSGAASSASYPASTPSSAASGTTTAAPTGAGNATVTGGSPTTTAVPAGAAVAGSIGGFAMLALGALAAF